jgi:hypothetical protein
MDSLIIKDAIICASKGDFKNRHWEINLDSALVMFTNSFQKLPINLLINIRKVGCINDFFVQGRVKYRKFDFSELHSLVIDEKKSVLIPIIGFKYITRISPIVGFSPDPHEANLFVELAILVFQDKKLTYFKSRLFFSEPKVINNSNESFYDHIKQEHVDTLVQLTMKDYIERMK